MPTNNDHALVSAQCVIVPNMTFDNECHTDPVASRSSNPGGDQMRAAAPQAEPTTDDIDDLIDQVTGRHPVDAPLTGTPLARIYALAVDLDALATETRHAVERDTTVRDAE